MNRLLIRMPNWIGDAVMASAVLHSIKAQRRITHIELLIKPGIKGLFSDDPGIDRIITFNPNQNDGRIPALITSAFRIIHRIFDTGLILPNSFDSALQMYLARIPDRIGYAHDGRSLLLTKTMKIPAMKAHQIQYYLNLLSCLDLRTEWHDPKLYVAPRRISEIRQFRKCLGLAAPVSAAFFPGAAYGPAKQWPIDRFVQLGVSLSSRYHGKVALLGSIRDRAACSAITGGGGQVFVDLAGVLSLEQTMAFLRDCPVCVANDSGGMHMAAALGVPTIGIFGPTDPEITAPVGPAVSMAVGQADCRPCKLRKCDRDHRCMHSITVDRVLTAIEELLHG